MTDILDYLPKRLAGNPLQSMKSDSDIEAIAEAVINASSFIEQVPEVGVTASRFAGNRRPQECR